jgi:glycosyltransferase involved in cell wall biosynthesis
MTAESLPRVSVIIPTLNAAGILGACLRAVAGQDYPGDLVQILVADGRSTDNTRHIAEQAGAQVLDNPHRIAEQGKRVALGAATGDYILFVDADNELTHTDFLRLAVEALRDHPRAIGVESYYPASPRFSSFCNYLNATLHIGDPISWLMSVSPVALETVGDVERWGFPDGRLAYPLGANGFLFRRADLLSVGALDAFEDTQMALKLALTGRHEWLRVKGRGVYHYLVKGLGDFIRKRRRQAYHHFSLRGKDGLSWTTQRPQTAPMLACLYCATLVGPVYHTLRGWAQTGDARWLWHPAACCASLLGLMWGAATYLTSSRSADAEAKLQPVQKHGGGA